MAQFLIGGKTHERRKAQIRCNSGVDGIVRIKEGKTISATAAGLFRPEV
jgi:hypothetical protein